MITLIKTVVLRLQIKLFLKLWALLIGVFPMATAADELPSIMVVINPSSAIHNRLVDGLEANLNNKDEILVVPVSRVASKLSADKPQLIVSVGTAVTESIVELNPKQSILSVAIPRLSFQVLREDYNNNTRENTSAEFSAIYLDQPLSRTLNLVQQLLPGEEKIGFLLGPDTLKYKQEISDAVDKKGLVANIGHVENESEIISSLTKVLKESDVMLGIVDPLVFSRTSSRNVLRTTYGWRVPLIAISPAYVKAGALATVYSTPEQLGEDLASTINSFTGTLPQPRFPELFSVALNYRSAEALGIQAPSESAMAETLKSLEKKDVQTPDAQRQ